VLASRKTRLTSLRPTFLSSLHIDTKTVVVQTVLAKGMQMTRPWVLAAAAAAVSAVALAVAGCSSGPAQQHYSGAVQTGAGGPAGPSDHAASMPTVRLGYMAAVQDGIALVGLERQLFQRDLGGSIELDAVLYPSAAAETAALLHGQLDAAYIDPVDAVEAWQGSGGDFRIVAGASSLNGATTSVLVVSAMLLTDKHDEVLGLLKGQIEAAELLNNNRTSAQAAIAAEFAALDYNMTELQLASLFVHVTFTNNPLPSSVASQAQQAVAAGRLRPVSGLSSIYDVGLLNELLRSAGLLQVAA
jgi:ABC-type nitrate/sulfonate/bicarbonate transport system substrate-binding protein